jgi:tripartite-type tricarboxylate transporter receptor subunit TctC
MKRTLIAALLSVAATFAAHAQDYPSKPIRLVIPYAAGSVAEVLFRGMMPVLEPRLNQRFIVDARPGADGNIGMAEAARAAPDGYTLVLAPTANFAVLDHLAKNLPFNALTSFDPISMIAETWPLCTVGPNVPAKSLKELADYVKANPGKYNYGSQGTGSPTHLIGAAFSQLNGNSMVHIPYKGTPPMITALLSGDIQVTFASMTAVLPQLKAGKLRALAVMGRNRQPELPDLPTAVEAGFPQLVMSNWWVVAGPKGTPQRAIDRMSAELRYALNDADVKKRFSDVGHIPVGMTPSETASFLKSESARYKGIVEAGHITLE